MNTTRAKPILIAGAGPTGMTAAMELSRFGIPVRLVDKKAAPEKTSRAIGVQARTLELFELRGLAEEMLKIGNKSSGASIYGGGRRVFRLDYSHIESRYGYILFISQAETERVLREELAKAGVTIERPVEMIAFAQRESSSTHHGSDSGVTYASTWGWYAGRDRSLLSYQRRRRPQHSTKHLGARIQGQGARRKLCTRGLACGR